MDKSVSGWNLVDLWLFRETGRAVFFLQKYDLNILSILPSRYRQKEQWPLIPGPAHKGDTDETDTGAEIIAKCRKECTGNRGIVLQFRQANEHFSHVM